MIGNVINSNPRARGSLMGDRGFLDRHCAPSGGRGEAVDNIGDDSDIN